MKQLIVIAFFISNLTLSFGQTPNYLDPNFGDTGTVVMPLEKEVQWGNDRIQALATQSTGKIITGWLHFGVIRHFQNGTVDSSFGVNGRLIGNVGAGLSSVWDILIQQDDKIIATGSVFAAARFTKNGEVDSTFNKIGKITADKLTSGGCAGAALQSDGKIVLAGSDNGWVKVLRINVDGTMDSTFHGDGIFTEKYGSDGSVVKGIKIRPNGKILVCGDAEDLSINNFLLIQLNPNGFLDSSFGDNGAAISQLNGYTFNHDMAIQQNGKVILAGRSVFSGALMARYKINGSLDSNFGVHGFVSTSMPSGDIGPEEIELDGNGNIYLGGHINKVGIDDDFYLLRYTPDGIIDTSFAKNGIETKFGKEVDRVRDMIIQPDGKIILAGFYEGDIANLGAMARYLPFPVSVENINKTNTQINIYPNPANSTITIKGLPAEQGHYYITDISGKRLLSDYKAVTIDQINIDVSNLPYGIYTFHFLSSDNDHLLKQFLKH